MPKRKHLLDLRILADDGLSWKIDDSQAKVIAMIFTWFSQQPKANILEVMAMYGLQKLQHFKSSRLRLTRNECLLFKIMMNKASFWLDPESYEWRMIEVMLADMDSHVIVKAQREIKP